MSFEIKLKLPDNIDISRETRTVCIDKGITRTLKYLWKNNIQTLSCCSGHKKEFPSIVISQEYSDKDVLKIKKLIKKVDRRKWIIYQWRLTKV
jgi:hypothetical protein